ncbi:MAG: hypothetical protein KatS3mg129_2864 [Leptospiraceae bacterium]|nr:MAG: hypothetical protein KatS3mg129_2864 [Leptospiraceae bacterium]
MPLLKKKDIPRYNYNDYLQWEGRWELIEGIPYAMSPAPNPYHQKISSKINTILNIALERCEKCIALLPVDWKIDEYTIVQPDNLVICYPLEDKPYITKAPSIIFEVISESTEKKDREIKYKLYEEQKVLYYVIVDPKKKSIEIYKHNGRKYKKETISNNLYIFNIEECKIEFDFNKIW